MRASRSVARREDGMTLVEILVATLILFFAVTAVLGLVAASTRTNVQAKQQIAAVNRVQSYVERVRRLRYDQVGVATSTVPGALLAEEQFEDDGIRITVRPTVEWVDDPGVAGEFNYKKVILDVTAVTVAADPENERTFTFTTETFVRESESNRPENAVPPEVTFQSGTPPINGVVYGSAVNIYARAWTPMENGVLAHLRFYCDGRAMRDSATPPNVAEWPLSEWEAYRSFAWDTLKLDEDGQPFSPDGARLLKIQTWDNVGQTTYRLRQVIVDNYAPDIPGSMTVNSLSDVKVRVGWPFAMDGTDPAYGYRLGLWKELASATWTYNEQFVGNVTGYDQATTAFSRYYAGVQATSNRDLRSGWRYTGVPYYSRSSFTTRTFTNVFSGSGAAKKATTTVNLVLGAPTFPYTGIVNTLRRSTSPDMAGSTVVGTPGAGFSMQDTYETIVGSKGVPTAYYYQVESTFKPTGWPNYDANANCTVRSAIVGPVGSANSGTLAVAGW